MWCESRTELENMRDDKKLNRRKKEKENKIKTIKPKKDSKHKIQQFVEDYRSLVSVVSLR